MRHTPVGGSLRVALSPLAGGELWANPRRRLTACSPLPPFWGRRLRPGKAGSVAPAERGDDSLFINAIFPPGRPKEKTAPSGGSAVHEVTSVGAM